MTHPIIATALKELNCDIRHDGLDLRAKKIHGKSHQDFGPLDYELLCKGLPFGNDAFDTKRIQHLLSDAIYKFYEAKGSVKETIETKAKEVKEEEIPNELIIKNGIHIKKVVKVPGQDAYDFYSTEENNPVDPEIQRICADLFHLLAIAKSAIEDKMMQVNNKMKTGTLDSDKRTKELMLHTENGPVLYNKPQVPKKLLLTTLWYMLRLHQASKQFLNLINLEVEFNGYKAQIIKGEVHLVTEGLSPLTLEIYKDLRNLE